MENQKMLSNIERQIDDFDYDKFRDIRKEFISALKEVIAEEKFTKNEMAYLENNKNIIEKCYEKYDINCLTMNDIKYSARDCLSIILDHLDLEKQPYNSKKHSNSEM